MARITKYYFTERLIRRIGVQCAMDVICHVAELEGRRIDRSELAVKPDALVDAVNAFDDDLREEINAAFRNIQGVGRCPKVKPTVIQILRNNGRVRDDAEQRKLLDDINSRDLFRVAAYLFCHQSTKVWKEICLMARQLKVAESAWLTFGVRGSSAPDMSDDAQESLRKEICRVIFENEGRADEGWCSAFHDEDADEYSFVIDMTDHLGDKKERFAKNRFHVVPRKEVFDILFRYKPKLGELSIRAEGPRDYRKHMCELWIANILGGQTALEDAKCKYRLDGVLNRASMALSVDATSPVTRAEIESVEIGSAVYEDLRLVWRSARGDLKSVVMAALGAAGIPREELRVERIDIRFHYLDRNGDAVHDIRYFRRDATNVVRAPDAIKKAIPKILADNGITA